MSWPIGYVDVSAGGRGLADSSGRAETAAVACIWDDQNGRGTEGYAAYWCYSPDAGGGFRATEWHRTVRGAAVRRVNGSVPIYRNGRRLEV